MPVNPTCGQSPARLITALILVSQSVSAVAETPPIDSYLDMDLSALLSTQVTSVSKKKQSLTETPAAVFVITQEDIRRSGVTTIPDALRMAPGVQVGKIDSNKWAISARGFNSRFANKLLVLIDGRSVYSSTYSGTYWDAQDTLLEDIDRIEVIRGPGATVWGANAVNGVINIITKHAAETEGGLVTAGFGKEQPGFGSFRYGSALDENIHGRMYAKYARLDSSHSVVSNSQTGDDWDTRRAGFRIDGKRSAADSWTLQGDIYNVDEDQRIGGLWLDPTDPANNPPDPASPYLAVNSPDNIDSSGWNLLGKWELSHNETSSSRLQVYLDHTERNEAYIGQKHNTLDIEFENRFSPRAGHDLVWGLGYRRIEDKFQNTFNVSLLPSAEERDLFSAFLQDEIELTPTTRLTLGSKIEHNAYTDFEVQPSIRGLWLPAEGHTTWAAVSRASRTPSRVDASGQLATLVLPSRPPTIGYTNGSPAFASEEVTTYELGYRAQTSSTFSFDAALFLNDYKNLWSLEVISMLGIFPTQVQFGNGIDATGHGLELAIDWSPTESWRLQGSYSYTSISANHQSSSNDTLALPVFEGSSPKHQASVRSSIDLSDMLSLDLWAIFVSKLESTSYSTAGVLGRSPKVPAYFNLNARIAWRPYKDLELSLVGMNLLEDSHAEFIGEIFSSPTEVERSLYGQARWTFD